MHLKLFKVALRAFEHRVRSRHLDGLHSYQRIQQLLQGERARAERSGGRLSMVVFGPIADRVNLSKVGRTLIRRARSTDHLGHFRDSHLCVIMPDTPTEGAHVFANDMMELLESKFSNSAQTPFEVFAFPTQGSKDPETSDRRGNWQSSPVEPVADRRHAVHRAAGAGMGESRLRIGGSRLEPAIRAGVSANLHIAAVDNADTVNAADNTGESEDSSQPRLTIAGETSRSMDELLSHPLPAWKRATDIAGALLGLFFAWPFMLAAAVMIKVTSPGPIMFKQPRAGLGGKPFHILKFRTMVVNADKLQAGLMKMNEQDGPAFKIRNDPRITPIGKFLRKTSLDELPQLLNVLKGEMSLVGPRPLPIKEQDACNVWQRRRASVTPGLTCIWQVAGRSTVSFDKWARMDVNYIESRTFFNDLKIILMTVPAVVLSKGAR
jgi:lipopolysaccharide/colanic/teichoic acid biosynthesis glycosyltransferase